MLPIIYIFSILVSHISNKNCSDEARERNYNKNANTEPTCLKVYKIPNSFQKPNMCIIFINGFSHTISNNLTSPKKLLARVHCYLFKFSLQNMWIYHVPESTRAAQFFSVASSFSYFPRELESSFLRYPLDSTQR